MTPQLRRRSLLAVLAVLALLTAAACSSDTDVDLEIGPDAEAAADDPVTLLDAGEEPRIELRLDITEAQDEMVVVTQSQEVTQLVDGEAAPSAGALETITELALRTTPNDDGTLTVVSEVTDVRLASGVDPATAPQIEAALAELVGTRSESVLSTRGLTVETELSTSLADQTAGEVLGDLTEQVSNPFPAEAVGVGASWQIGQTLLVTGVEVEQLSEVTLVSIDGDQVELAITTEQFVAADATMELGQDVEAIIEDWTFTGSGSSILDLTKSAAVSSTTTSQGTQTFNVDDLVTVEQRISSVISTVGS